MKKYILYWREYIDRAGITFMKYKLMLIIKRVTNNKETNTKTDSRDFLTRFKTSDLIKL
jgi:hypothetical protein